MNKEVSSYLSAFFISLIPNFPNNKVFFIRSTKTLNRMQTSMEIPSDLNVKDPMMSDYHLQANICSSDAESVLTIDEALTLAGNENFYQKRTAFFLSLQWLVLAFIIQGQSFLFLPPTFLCEKENNGFSECPETSACRSDPPIIDTNSSKNTITSEFQLYCARGYYKSLTQMLFFTGSNVAILFFSFISDLRGRKSTLIFTYGLGAISLLIARFAVSWYMFMFFLVFAGIGINPYTSLSFVLLNESAGDGFRQMASISLLATYGFGQLLFILLAYAFSDWRILLLYCIAIPLALQTITFLWIYESPKFLLSKKEFKQAKSVIMKIAKLNKRKMSSFIFKEQKEYEDEIKKNLIEKVKEISPDDLFKEKEIKEANTSEIEVSIENPEEDLRKYNHSTFNEIIKNHIDHNDLYLFHKFPLFRQQLKRQKKLYTVFDLLAYRSQLLHTLIFSVVYFSIYMTYYGLIFSMESIGGNIYISALVQTSAELIAYLCTNFIIRFLKRRLALSFCLFAQSLACLLTLEFMHVNQILVLATVSRFFTAMALSIMSIYTAEVYPTTVRSLGIGLTSFIGKFGCALAPMLGTVFQYTLMLHPMVSYGILAGIASFAALFIKETLGLPMEEEIPELVEEKIRKTMKQSEIKSFKVCEE